MRQSQQRMAVACRFDDLTRAIGGSQTRRGALRLLSAGVIGAALGPKPVKPRASGADEGSCYLQFSPGPSCAPVTDYSALASCNNLQQSSGGSYNGCGSKGVQLDGHLPGGVNITRCCNAHDCCYDQCGRSKSFCDDQFLACMEAACRKYSSLPRDCINRARHVYYEGVVKLGGPSYRDAQVESCGCCTCPGQQSRCSGTCTDTKSDPSNCGGCGITCSGAEVCQDGACICPSSDAICSGQCVDLQTDTSNCGECGNVCPAGYVCECGGGGFPPGICLDPDTTQCCGPGFYCPIGTECCGTEACCTAPAQCQLDGTCG